MGHLLIVEGVGSKKQEYDTVSCKHCQAVIKVVIAGVSKAYETKHRCDRCKGPICRYCAENLGGRCSPIMAKVEHALKTGVWDNDHVYEFKILPHR